MKLISLVRIYLLHSLGLNRLIKAKTAKEKSKAFFIVLLVLFVLASILGLSFLYSFLMASSFMPLGLIELLPACMFVVTSLILFFTTVYNVRGVLFSFKDYDQMMSLPIGLKTIVFSRLLILYGANLLLSLLILVPAMVAYGMVVSPPAFFYAIFLLCAFLTPMLPTVLALAVGLVICLLAARFRKSGAMQTVLMFAFFLLVFWGSMRLPHFIPQLTRCV